MRRKGDSKVLENQVKMQQNSHLHGADNPTYLKAGSDKVSAPRSESQSQSLSHVLQTITNTITHTFRWLPLPFTVLLELHFWESQGVCTACPMVSTRNKMCDHSFF